MEKIIRWFVSNKVVSNLLMVLILVTGATTIPSLKMEVFPEIELNIISVTTVYPGATPSDVEQAICIKIEERLQGLDGVKKKTDPGDPVKEDIYKMTKSERKKHGIDTLPANLGRALDELESDRKFLTPIFSNEVLDKIIELERRDHREIAIRPHPHEFYLYFDV